MTLLRSGRLVPALLALLGLHACHSWQTVAPPQPPQFSRSREPLAAIAPSDASALPQRNGVRDPAQAQLDLPLPSLDDASELASDPLVAPVFTVRRPMLQPLDEKTKAMQAEMLEDSYEQCRQITEVYAKTFYFGTSFFAEDKRKAVWAVYAWCRRTDDIVDKPRKDSTSLRDELQQWRERLHDVWQGRAHDAIDLALVDTVRNYPTLSIEPFEDMIKGMVMDLDQNRFETFEELYVYCYRVAGTVGLMVLPIMGTAPGYTAEEALEPALALGVALQLTNILRDVGEDRARQRIYLPGEDLRRFKVTEAALLNGVKDERYVNMLKFQIERAREWYERAESGIPMLSEDARLPVRASLDMYSAILNKIESNAYDNFNKRAYTAKWEKLLMLPRAWLRVSEMNR
jgi:phytoene synthase